jgi:hypothetical protein
MCLKFVFPILFSALVSATAVCAPLDGKGPAYFVDRYGLAKSAKTMSSTGFLHIGAGFIEVRGQFSERVFRKGDLTVRAIFFLPSLELAAVRLDLPHQWTPEQLEAALIAYGGQWQVQRHPADITTWTAPDGSQAINLLLTLEIQSKAAMDLIEKTLADREAKQKAVPKF